MAESRKTRFLLKLLRLRVAIPLLILLALVSAPFIYRARQLSGLPDIGDPFDVEAFGTVVLDDADNAFVEYCAAVKLLVPLSSGQDVEDELYEALEGNWKVASPTIRKWVVDNRPAMEIWRRGTEKPGALYHQPRDVTLSTPLGVAYKLRGFSRLADLEASRLADSGDMQAAWEWHRAVLRSSRHSGMHGSGIERLIGIALHAIAAERIVDWSADPRVTPAQLREALQAVREGYKDTVPLSENIKVEYLILQKILMRDDLPEFDSAFGSDSGEMANKLSSVLFFLNNEPELSRRLIQHLFANALARAEKPLHARTVSGRTKSPSSMNLGLYEAEAGTPSGARQMANEDLKNSIQRSLLVRILLPDLDQYYEGVRGEQVRQAALVVILAAEIYRRDRGQYPEKAEDLVGKYLDALPADPYGKAGETMHYRRDENGIVVWGVGENGVDDGGDFEYRGGDHSPDFGLRSGGSSKPGASAELPTL